MHTTTTTGLRLRRLPPATPPPRVGLLYRHKRGMLLRVTAVQGTAVTLRSSGHHIYGATKPPARARIVHATYAPGWGLLTPGNHYRVPVVPYTVA